MTMPLPVPAGTPVTLGYRQKPKSPALKNYIHRGVDYGARPGTTITSTAAGKVVHAGTGGMGSAFGLHVVILTGGIWHIYAHLSRVDVKRGTQVHQGQRVGLSGATGNVTGAHLHYGEFTRYSYLADRKPQFLAVATSRGPVVVTAVQNMAGNNAQGSKTGRARAAQYAEHRRDVKVDVLLTQEDTVASGIRPTLDAKLKGVLNRTGGGEGRYVRTAPRLKKIAGGMVTAAKSTWFKGDDKQAGWVVYEVEAVRGMDVSFHLESDSGTIADAKRVEQMTSIVTQTLALAKKYGVRRENILWAGDTNSEGLVARVLANMGIRNAAAGTPFEHRPTFVGWDRRNDKRLDYAFTAGNAVVESIGGPFLSDHVGLRVRRHLIR